MLGGPAPFGGRPVRVVVPLNRETREHSPTSVIHPKIAGNGEHGRGRSISKGLGDEPGDTTKKLCCGESERIGEIESVHQPLTPKTCKKPQRGLGLAATRLSLDNGKSPFPGKWQGVDSPLEGVGMEGKLVVKGRRDRYADAARR